MPLPCAVASCGRRAFTLIELLVVISIIALLIGILLPTLGQARFRALVLQDLSNMRQLQLAHYAYVTDNGGFMINAGLPHGFAPANGQIAWVNTLKRYYNDDLALRSPIDDSPHWEDGGGVPVPLVSPVSYRLTSYGINAHLCDVDENGSNPWGPKPPAGILGDPRAGPAYTRIDMVDQPSDMVHFVIMAFEGEFAGADHGHPEAWGNNPMGIGKAPEQIEINAVAGPERSFEAKSNYAFLDGSAKTAEFGDVYVNGLNNRFDPHPIVARP